MGIEQVVDVQISRQTQVPTVAGFGTAAYLTAVGTLTEPKSYQTLAEVTADSAAAGADSVAFATAYFGQDLRPTKLTVLPDTGANITASLDAAVELDNDWYALASATKDAADLEEIANWVQSKGNSNPKLYFGMSADPEILDGTDDTDIASVTKISLEDRTIIAYKANSDEFVGAWLGKCLPTKPGSITWAFKSLASIAPDTLTPTQITAVLDKSANIYQRIAGINMTANGTTAAEWIDVMRGVDWMTANIATNVFGLMVSKPKIPFTDAGVSQIKDAVSGTLSVAAQMGILADVPLVTAPLVADVSAADKAARKLPDVKFEGVLAGAIQKVEVRGIVTL